MKRVVADPITQLPNLLESLTRRGDLRNYAKGEMVVEEGELDSSLFVLVAGRMKVFTRDERGRELVYNVMKAGEFFGELGLDGGLRSASIKAMEPSQCVVVGRDELRKFLVTHPDFTEYLVLALIQRLRLATRQIRGLALSDVYARTVEVISAEAIEHEGVVHLPRGLTHREIAERVGATREMIGRIMRELERGGFLKRDEQRRLVMVGAFPKRW